MESRQKGRTIPVAIEDEIKESYLNYAMSVIVSRALPDVRDGLKPVHRRILYAMNEMGLKADRSFKKCGRIVGDVLGKYHPHGDQSIYEALVRLAQSFSLRYPVVRGQGNFGSIDGDPPAAMRYTEAKMQKIAEELLKDIKKETVDYGPNYDDSMTEPLVLPAAIPFLLLNGASGIAVGMATNMPPHNLREICSAINAYIDNPEITIDEIIADHVKGPDFPTAGIICGRKGLRDAFKTGKGKVTVRSRFTLETKKSGKEVIIITEIPYMVNKANLVIRIANLVKDKKIDGISDLRDESDKDGMRIVIELKKGVIPKVVLNGLFSHTSLQSNFNVSNLALVNGRPKQLNIKEMISAFVKHRQDVITRRTKFELKKAEAREHILLGLKIALDNIDEVVKIIRSSKNVDDARDNLMKTFSLSERQSQAILDMRLQKLTSLETKKIVDELNEIRLLITYLKDLLANEHKILNIIKEDTDEISKKYGDDRKTEIVNDEIQEINIEDLIQEEDMVVLISNKGFIKRIPVSAYKNQGRGGKGSGSAKLVNDDFLEHLFIASTHDYIMFITTEGKAFWLKVHEIPEASRLSRGQSVKTLFAISANEEISAVLTLKEFTEDSYIFMSTRNGIVKKVTTKAFSNAKTRGIRAINLDEGDQLVSALLTNGDSEVVLVTRQGIALRYHEKNVRVMGRASRGVLGINLTKQDELSSVLRINPDEQIIILSEFGYGKRINFDNFTPHGRRTKGQIAYKINDKSGEITGALTVQEKDELVCISSQGKTIRLKISEIPVFGKTAFGVRVVNINKPDFLVGIARLVNEDEEGENGSEAKTESQIENELT